MQLATSTGGLNTFGGVEVVLQQLLVAQGLLPVLVPVDVLE
jgi:hypothetical protein